MYTSRIPSRLQIIIAFTVLYIVWGSTYLGIKVAVETMPPLLMAAARFIPAGAILFGFALWRHDSKLPSRRDFLVSSLVGCFLILGGNGLVTMAEQSVDSTLAAVLLSSNPIFVALFATIAGIQKRPSRGGLISLLFGFLGVCLLVYATFGIEFSGSGSGLIMVFGAVVFWTLGTVYSKANPSTCSPFMSAGIQMCVGGVFCLVVAVARGELNGFELESVSLRSWVAYLYLLFFGALAGFTSFVFLLKHCSPSAVSSHAYVNPVVALVLGALILDEHFNALGWFSSAIVLLSVFVLLSGSRRSGPKQA